MLSPWHYHCIWIKVNPEWKNRDFWLCFCSSSTLRPARWRQHPSFDQQTRLQCLGWNVTKATLWHASVMSRGCTYAASCQTLKKYEREASDLWASCFQENYYPSPRKILSFHLLFLDYFLPCWVIFCCLNHWLADICGQSWGNAISPPSTARTKERTVIYSRFMWKKSSLLSHVCMLCFSFCHRAASFSDISLFVLIPTCTSRQISFRNARSLEAANPALLSALSHSCHITALRRHLQTSKDR